MHSQVETVMLAGTLILLLMTANTLMLYSMPASRPGMEQEVVFPRSLISSCTPENHTSILTKDDIFGFRVYKLLSILNSSIIL